MRLLVQCVVDRIGAAAFEGAPAPDLSERIELILREVAVRVTNAKEASVEPDRWLDLAREEKV